MFLRNARACVCVCARASWERAYVWVHAHACVCVHVCMHACERTNAVCAGTCVFVQYFCCCKLMGLKWHLILQREIFKCLIEAI